MKRKQRGGYMNYLNPSYMKSIQEKATRALMTGVKMGRVAALNRVSESLKQATPDLSSQSGSGIRRRRISRKKKRTNRKHGVHSRRVV